MGKIHGALGVSFFSHLHCQVHFDSSPARALLFQLHAEGSLSSGLHAGGPSLLAGLALALQTPLAPQLQTLNQLTIVRRH